MLQGLMSDPRMWAMLANSVGGAMQGGQSGQGQGGGNDLMNQMLMMQMLKDRQQPQPGGNEPLLAQANAAAEPLAGQLEKDRFGIEIAPAGQAPYQTPQQAPAPGMPSPFGGGMDQNMMQTLIRLFMGGGQ